MKILRITTLLDYGGIETKMANLAHIKDDNEWVFVSIGKGGKAESRIRENDKRVVCLNLNHRIPNPFTLYKVYQFIKKENPDVVHSAGAEANFFGFIAAKIAKVPRIIVEEIGIAKTSSIGKLIFQKIYAHADYVIGESKAVTKDLDKHYKINPSKLKVIHNFGIFKLKDFARLKTSNRFHIIMISRLEPVKNIEGVIKVVERLINNGLEIQLTIAGVGSLEKSLHNLVTDLGLKNYVNLIGFIQNPYPYLLQADLYILNSFSEGFSNSLIEAMYSKTPSLSTNVGSADEVIQDNINGFLISVDDEALLYSKISEIMKMPEQQMIKIGQNAHDTIIENFSIENHVNELMKLYQQ